VLIFGRKERVIRK